MDDVRAVLSGERRWTVIHGDSAEVLATLPPSSVDAVVCDPPAGIRFMNLAFDHDRGGRAQWVAWLAGILASARVATKDGGRMFAWALPRTSHWTGCAVEDAGWSVENTVQHLFATGWPKGSSQLKPAQETWWLARTGRSTPLNIDAARIGTAARVNMPAQNKPGSSTYNLGVHGAPRDALPRDALPRECAGRWPPNAVFSHAPGCVREGTRRVESASQFKGGAARKGNVYGGDARERPPAGYADPDGTELVESWRCAEGCVVAELDAQAGAREGRAYGPMHRGAVTGRGAGYGSTAKGGVSMVGYDTDGESNASRFYPCFPADDPADPWNEALFRYVAKPSRAEKETGVADDVDRVSMETGFPGGACEATGQRSVKSVANSHPTVKPIALMRWLIRLITQPGDLVIDPFGGSGTTGAAALLEGRRVVIIEKERRFVDIARARCEHAAPTPERLARVATEPVRVVAPDYGPLFGGRP